jgi:hypothetical protein
VQRTLLALAETDLYRPRSGLSQYMLWIAAFGAVVLTIVGFHLWNLSRKPRDRRSEEASPDDVLSELCRVHELSRVEQALLIKMAHDQQLPLAAALFVDPEPFNRATGASDADPHACRALRYKLFGAFE